MIDPIQVEKLLFQLSCPLFDEKAVENVTYPGDADLAAIAALARQNGVAGFVYRNTKDLNVFPEQMQQGLHAAYRNTTFRNLDQVAELLKILKLLSAHQIRVVPLKGVVASETIFHDLGVYPSGDIDILIHPADLSAVKKVLADVGYNPAEEWQEEDLLIGHYHLMFRDGRHLLEVHWNLAKRYFEVPPDFWWQGSRAVCWRDMDVVELVPEKYLLYTIFRLYDHCFYPLRFFVLIAGILETWSHEIRWDVLLTEARQYKMMRLTLFTLQFLHQLFNCPIPDHILQQKILGYGALKKLVLSGIFKGIHRKHLRMLLYTSLLDSPKQIVNVLIGRIFPPKSELCLRYNLPPDSPWIWFYFFANPILLLWKR